MIPNPYYKPYVEAIWRGRVKQAKLLGDRIPRRPLAARRYFDPLDVDNNRIQEELMAPPAPDPGMLRPPSPPPPRRPARRPLPPPSLPPPREIVYVRDPETNTWIPKHIDDFKTSGGDGITNPFGGPDIEFSDEEDNEDDPEYASRYALPQYSPAPVPAPDVSPWSNITPAPGGPGWLETYYQTLPYTQWFDHEANKYVHI